jgi:hypothetical protein
LQITLRPELKSVVTQGADAVVLYELETAAPAAATTLVTEWRHLENGKISRVQSVFDAARLTRCSRARAQRISSGASTAIAETRPPELCKETKIK